MSMKMQLPIPSDWNGTDWICQQIWIPDSREWRAAVRGSIYALARGRSWDGKTGTITSAQATGYEIYRRYVEDDSCTACADPDPGECTTFPANANFITFYPNHPDYQPNVYYPFPTPVFTSRWHRDNALLQIILGGILGWGPDDLWCTLAVDWPQEDPGDWATIGPPSFTVWLEGEGVVELHMIAIPFGGYVISMVDGDILQTTYTSLSVDWLESTDIEIDAVDEVVHEIQISGPGPHRIQTAFIPIPETSPPFIGFGGGLRSVVLCGPDIVGVEPVPDFRVVDCGLQVMYPGGSWQDIEGDYNLCGSGVDIRVNPSDPCELQVTHDGGDTWDFLIDVCQEASPQLQVRQNTSLPCKLEYSADGGTQWYTFADLNDCLDGLPPQLLVRQSDVTPCKLQYSDDGGVTWYTFADITECQVFDPPDPPPTVTDPDCAMARAAATEIVEIVLDIVENHNSAAIHSFADYIDFSRYLVKEWPGYFAGNMFLPMFLAMLSHVGTSWDYAPITTASEAHAIDELAYGAYCAILGTPAPLIPFSQKAWGQRHLPDGETITYYKTSNSDASELLDLAAAWLYMEAFKPDMWSIMLTAWSQQDDTAFDCSESGCTGGVSFGDDWTVGPANEWVGSYINTDWQAEYLDHMWEANDYHYPGAGSTDWRRCAEINIELPRGDVTSIRVDFDVDSCGTTAAFLRLYWTPVGGSESWLHTVSSCAPGEGYSIWSGTADDIQSIRVMLIIDQKTSEAALTGGGRLTSVTVTYDTGTPDVFDVDMSQMSGVVGNIEHLFHQVYAVNLEYTNSGGLEYWGGFESTDVDCYTVRAGIATNPSADYSQSASWTCADNLMNVFNPQGRWNNNSNPRRAHRFRAATLGTMYMLIAPGGTES